MSLRWIIQNDVWELPFKLVAFAHAGIIIYIVWDNRSRYVMDKLWLL